MKWCNEEMKEKKMEVLTKEEEEREVLYTPDGAVSTACCCNVLPIFQSHTEHPVMWTVHTTPSPTPPDRSLTGGCVQ